MELRRMNVQTADKGEEPLKPPNALPAQTHSRRWGAGPRSPSSRLRQRRVRSLRTLGLSSRLPVIYQGREVFTRPKPQLSQLLSDVALCSKAVLLIPFPRRASTFVPCHFG